LAACNLISGALHRRSQRGAVFEAHAETVGLSTLFLALNV
jgi:hypothetical protein